MNSNQIVDYCPFCAEFTNPDDSQFRTYVPKTMLPTRILGETKNFVVLAGLGAFRPGYVLLLSREHCITFSSLNPEEMREAESIKDDIVEKMRLVYGTDVLIFEHGSQVSAKSAGGCIDHAHLHLFATGHNLQPILDGKFKRRRIENLIELTALYRDGLSYLYCEYADQRYVYLVDESLPSQYCRRLLAEAEGKQSEWNWCLFPGTDNVVDTVKTLSHECSGGISIQPGL